MSEVVWWSSKGHVLHRRAECPALAAAIRRSRQRFEIGVFKDDDPVIYSYDFGEDVMTEGLYPPEAMDLCRRCGRAR